MYDLAIKIESCEPLIEALCLLQYLLSNSPSNFHAKLLCLHLYHILGCGIGAQQMYTRLDIKHVQLDSMGYLHCVHLPRIGIASLAKPIYGQTLKFFTTSYKESLEYLAMCYKFGSFSKLEEFMDFRERLSNSLHYSLTSAEAMLMEMVVMGGNGAAQALAAVNGMTIMPCEDRIDWSALVDNRDLTVICRWDSKMNLPWPLTPQQQQPSDATSVSAKMMPMTNALAGDSDDVASESFRQDVELLRVRVTLLRLVDACIGAITIKDGSVSPENGIETLTKLRGTWLANFATIRRQNMRPTSNGFLVNLLPSRLHGMLTQPYERHFGQLGRLMLALARTTRAATAVTVADDDCDEDGSDCVTLVAKEYEQDIGAIGQLVVDTIKKHNEATDLVYGRRAVQETIVNCIEVS